jgi:hypothetical protein
VPFIIGVVELVQDKEAQNILRKEKVIVDVAQDKISVPESLPQLPEQSSLYPFPQFSSFRLI